MTLNKAKSLLPVIEPVSIDANKTFIVSLDITSGSFLQDAIFYRCDTASILYERNIFLAKKL